MELICYKLLQEILEIFGPKKRKTTLHLWCLKFFALVVLMTSSTQIYCSLEVFQALVKVSFVDRLYYVC